MSRAEFPAGKYYVGDLCYVIPDALWSDVCNLIIVDDQVLNGQFQLKGCEFAIYSTAYGAGTYRDQMEREYLVDSGSIGCISIESIAKLSGNIDQVVENELGQVIDFDKSFSCYSDDGTIRFGSVAIATGSYYDDEDEYEESYIW